MKRDRNIERTIKLLRQQFKAAIEDLNQQASKLVARGSYDSSQIAVESARRMIEFSQQAEALWDAWSTVFRHDKRQAKGERTPVWEYYQLIAKGLIELGGEAKAGEVVSKVGSLGKDRFKSADLEATPSGLPVWARSVRRARAPMIKEGFLESIGGGRWRLTKLGRELPKRK